MSTRIKNVFLGTATAAALLLTAGYASAATVVNLTAQRATTTLPDGVIAKMWQFCGGLDTTQVNAGTATGGGCAVTTGTTPVPVVPGIWAPGPTITVPVGDQLTINLTNNLKVPTSIVVLGQLGGGLGQGARMAGPTHSVQAYTTQFGNSGPNVPGFTPPTQSDRVRSFGTEVASGAAAVPLVWTALKAGTYIYETGTLPSLEAPMGLYGLLIVTQAPTLTAPGNAYPPTSSTGVGVPYDSDAALLFSEIDPVLNAQVDAAEEAGTNINLRWNDPSCAPTAAPNVCYPAAVNYTPAYFLINGNAYDRTAPNLSSYPVGSVYSTGNVLLRLANAGLRTHIPSVVGLTFSLAAEDGNLAPGNAKVQSEALLTAGKTYDAIVTPPAPIVPPATVPTAYAAGTFAVFDRQLSLSNANAPDGGMQGYVLVNGGGVAAGAPGGIPSAGVAVAVNDVFAVPFNTTINGNVRLNDISVKSVTQTAAASGTLALTADGSFTYTPATGFNGTDTFKYTGNGGANGPVTNEATVTLTVGSATAPTALNVSFNSNVSTVYSTKGPGILAYDFLAPANVGFALTVDTATNGNCSTLSFQPDGAFTVTNTASLPSCTFTYTVKNAQGRTSASANVTVSFPTGSGLTLAVLDAQSGAPITDYRWVIQEDQTFKPTTAGTPSVSTRTLGTSFHRANDPVVATGCTPAADPTKISVSCGNGQSVRGVAATTGKPASSVGDVALDPTKRYYVSVLPGDAQNPILNGGGAPVPVAFDAAGNPTAYRQFDLALDCLPATPDLNPCGHMLSGTNIDAGQKVATIKLQPTPLKTADLSIYIYEDNQPTNGQDDINETGLGGFNMILFDPAGRTGDPAGQQTYDAFNFPLSNALLGTPGCPDDQNSTTNGTGTSASGNLVGVVYTCPNDPYEGTNKADPAKYALAGHALIKNITPARYDVVAHPGAAREGKGEIWWQTETLEGTPAQDAFTGVNEPTYFQEFGPPGFHTTIGFVNPDHVKATAQRNGLGAPGTGNTITGKVTNQRMSRPSNVQLWDSGTFAALSSTVCYVGLNSQGGTGPTIELTTCDADGNFSLTSVLPGTYELVVWDQWLDQIIQTKALTIPAAASGQTFDPSGNVYVAGAASNTIPVLSWFTQYDQNILLDPTGACKLTGNQTIDTCANLTGIPNVLMNVRFRNGAMSNQTLTDVHGNGILVEQFPLFNWYVAESDTTRFKQEAVNVVVDGGGAADTLGATAGIASTKYATGESTVRNETPGALTYGVQSFISERNQVNWIKTPYVPGENGGITGTVVYSATRPFDDQRYNVQNIWAPLVPRVTVNLYQRTKQSDGTVTLVLVDSTQTTSWDDFVNLVYGSDGNQYILGGDQVLRDPVTGAPAAFGVTAGKQVNIQCPGQLPGPAAGALPPFDTTAVDPFTTYTLGANDQNRCYDGFHNWNQVQAAPYDGRYSFPSAAYILAHPSKPAAGQTLVSLPPGEYVVEAVTPAGYEIVKEEDKSILTGDAFIAPLAQQFGGLGNVYILPDQATLNNSNPYNPNTGDPGIQSNATSNLGVNASKIQYAECVGALHRVPDFLSIYPQVGLVAPFAGMDRPLCDKKLVNLGDQMQASTSFFVFTPTPIAANNTGIILDDASSEFNAAAPDFGEKASVPFVPVSTKDFAGNEISRVYADQWGAYNVMLPSSWLVNPPTPSGYGPNMLVNCMNDPGPILDPTTGKMITDPQYNPAYSNFCYTNPFMPGQTTYLDTPVLPIAAFAAGYNPADCAYSDGTPAISRVDGDGAAFGPYVAATGGTLTIKALGFNGAADVGIQVQNPAYAGPFATSGQASLRTITRHYGFGPAQGTGKVLLGSTSLTVTSWTNDTIVATVPANTPTGELSITAGNGKSTVDAVTVTVGGSAPVLVDGAIGNTIQSAIDSAAPGTLILINAGTYNELLTMWKPVRLQGVGAASVIINAAKYPTSKLEKWRPNINSLFSIDTITGNQTGVSQVDPLTTQEITGGVVLLEPSVLGTEEGAGVTVLAKNLPASSCSKGGQSTYGHDITESNFYCQPSRIDGLSITGGDAGGGIYVNGWAHNLEISNNRVYGNAGALNGGVRIGVPYLELDAYNTGEEGRIVGFGFDKNVKIHHNAITKNGTVEGTAGAGGAGGGVSICTGTDGYSVDHNFVCGNFSSADGGGVGHIGFSQGGTIANNQILFNQSFQQTTAVHGGGIAVEGEPSIAGTLSLGTGNLTIDANVIRGNLAEAGHGGGIRLQQVNGAEVAASRRNADRWFKVTITNNIIDNNIAAYAGGGVSMADTLHAVVDSNTIASNDSVGIAGALLAGAGETANATGTGRPNPAGLSVDVTSPQLLAAMSQDNRAANAISNPELKNDIVWKNRSFFYRVINGNATLCSSNDAGNVLSACNTLIEQAATGQCALTNNGAPAYWDLGVVGDRSAAAPGSQPAVTLAVVSATQGGGGQGQRAVTVTTTSSINLPNGQLANVTIAGVTGVNSNLYNGTFTIDVTGPTTFRYSPTNNGVGRRDFAGLTFTAAAVGLPATASNLVLSPASSVITQGYAPNSNADPLLADLYCNGSRVTPEFAAVINPPSVKNLQVAATPDEGNNYVALRFGPLTASKPTDSTGTAYVTFGDYHLAPGATSATSSAVDHGADLGQTSPYNHDVDGDHRPGGPAFDIGADEIPVVTDLMITKTDGLTTVTAGQTVVYTIVASNAGLQPVIGAIVNDPVNNGQLVTPLSWTCTASTGSACPAASGTGPLVNVPVNLAAGGSVTFLLTAQVSPTAAGCAMVSNTVSIAPPLGVTDPTGGNNTATDTDQVTCPVADLSITKTASVSQVVANGTVVYTVTVTNNGPGAATGAVVRDVVPSAYTQVPNGWNWSCAPAALCGPAPIAGTGTINKTLGTLPAGASVTFTITAVVRDNNAVGTVISNTATVAAPPTVTDPNPGNNSSTVTVRVVGGGETNTVTPGNIAFGAVNRGSASPTVNVIVTNTGTLPLGIATLVVGGAPASAGDYTIGAPGGVNPPAACVANTTVLAPAARCAIGVRFTPTGANGRGAKNATLTVNSSATAKVVNLTGTAN